MRQHHVRQKTRRGKSLKVIIAARRRRSTLLKAASGRAVLDTKVFSIESARRIVLDRTTRQILVTRRMFERRSYGKVKKQVL